MTSLPAACVALAIRQQQEMRRCWGSGSEKNCIRPGVLSWRAWPWPKILLMLLFLPVILVVRLCLLPFQMAGKIDRVMQQMKIKSSPKKK